MAAGDAHPYPVYGYDFRVYFEIMDNDGDLVDSAAGLDSERSIDGATQADCTNEATQITSSLGSYFLDLTGAEMTCKCCSVEVKTSTTDAKTTPIKLYPIRLPVLETGTAQAGGSSNITLASGASDEDDHYNGYFVGITNNSPSGAEDQLRRIIDYNGTTKVATVDGDWATNPSSASNYEILIPEGYPAKDTGGVIQDACNAALEANGLDVLVKNAVSTATFIPTTNSVLAQMAASDGAWLSFDKASDSLQALRDNMISVLEKGTALGGTSSTITLPSGSPGTADILNLNTITITGGTGAKQTRQVTDYVITTAGAKIVTVSSDWTTTPSSDSTYELFGSTGLQAFDVDTDSVDVDDIGASGAATIKTQAGSAMDDRGLQYLVSTALTSAGVVVNDSIFAKIAATQNTAGVSDWDTFDGANDSLQAISESGGGGPTAAQIADAVWDENADEHVTAGTFGVRANTDIETLLNRTSTLITNVPEVLSLSNINDQCDAAIETYNLDILVRDAVADQNRIGDDSIIAQMMGKANSAGVSDFSTFDPSTDSLEAIADGAGGGGGASASAIADAVWDEDRSDHPGTNSFGAALQDILTLANIKTQITDALETDLSSEVTVPVAAAPLREQIQFLYQNLRNQKTQSATTRTMSNDAGTVVASSTVSVSGGVTTMTEFA